MKQITFTKGRKRLCNWLLTVLLAITAININAQSVVTIGTSSGANASNTYPCPLQDNAGASRAQYLYTAAELSAAFYGSGSTITQLGWITNSSPVFSHLIEGYTISVKNTGITTLSATTWETGLTVINGPANYAYTTSSSGNVIFNTSSFVYTGQSLLVEVCGGTAAGTVSGNPSCQWTTGLTGVMSHTYVVTGQAGCGNASTTNTGTTTNRPVLVLNSSYCTPTYSNVCGFMWINNFSTTGGTTNITNNGSACSAGAYGNFYTTMNVTQAQTSSINFSVSDNAAYGQGYSIWVDWNHNGIFTDAGEQVWTSGTTLGVGGVATGSFTVPATATLGATRMRVRSQYVTVPADPCVTYNYGETEDYKFTVTTAPPCSGTPAPGNTLSTVTNVCSDTSHFKLTLQNTTSGTGVTYQWQSSPTGSGYTNITGATSSYYYSTETASTYYQCRVTCSGNTGTSTPILVGRYTPVMTSGNYTSTCSNSSLNFPLTSNISSTFNVVATDNPSVYNEPTWGQVGYTSLFDNLINVSDTAQVVLYSVTPTDNSGGCVGATQTVYVTVYPTPKLDTAYSSPTSVCSGSTATLTTTTSWTEVMQGYCFPTITNGCGTSDIIYNVTFGSFSRTSSCDNLSGSNGYSLITSSHPTISAGVPTTLSVSTNGQDGAAVWIDYDQSGTFDASELVLSGYTGTYSSTYSASITIPTTAKNGTTMMRVRSNHLSNPSGLGACGSATGGETEDYYVTITGGASPLTYSWNPYMSVTSSSSAVTTTLPITSSTTFAVTGVSGTGCTTSRSTYIFVNTVPAVPTATASPSTICNGSSSTLTATTTIGPPDYCTPITDCSSFSDYISSVQFGSINNATYNCDDASGFTYMATPNPTFAAGSTYPLNIEYNTTNDNLAVWIDYDQNGVFDASELVFTDGGTTTSISTSVTIPVTAYNGTTRMRVRTYFEYGPTYIDACASVWNADGNHSNGETEDYAITIAGGTDPINYTWTPSTFLGSTSGSSVTASGVTSSTTYTVSATSALAGCAATGTATTTVSVNPVPVMTNASTQSVCSGSALNITLASTVASSYVWIGGYNANVTGISTTNQSTGVINDVLTNNTAVAQTVTYTVTPTATTGGCIGNPFVITVTLNPKPVMTSTGNATICSGTAVSIPLTSNVASTYSWIAANNASTVGESLTAQSTSTLSNTITNSTSAATIVSYTVTPTSTTGGCVGSAQNVFVTVNPAPTMTSAATATICSGGTVSIPLTSTVPSTYTWIATNNPNTTGESFTSQSTSTLTNVITNNAVTVQTVSYTVTPTASTGSCAGTPQTVSVTVNPTPTMTSATTATICSGGTVSIPLTSNVASTYTWIANDNPNTTGESITSQGTTTLSNTITNNTTSPQTIIYTVIPTSTAGSCVGTSQTVTVTVNPAPTMTSASTATICSGGTVSIPLASNVTSTYTWIATNNPNTTGESFTSQSTSTINNTITNNTAAVQTITYTVTPTATTGGCVGATQTVTVTVNPAPTMTSASAATICSGGTVSIPLTSNVASSYTWIAADNTNTTGESLTSQSGSPLSNTITNNSTAVQTVNYTVTPTATIGGCAGSTQTVVVTVNPLPTMTSATTTTICSGGTISIPLTSNVASSFAWIATDNVNTTGESLTSQSTTTLSNTITNNTTTTQTVVYTVTPTSTVGSCAGTPQTVTVTVNPAPTMTSAATASICSGGTVNIALASSSASTFTWIATDNVNTTGESLTSQSTSTLSNTITNNTTVVQTVNYTVTPTSLGGCAGTPQTVTVTVNPAPTMTSATTATTCSGGTVSIPLTSNVASTYIWIATDNINTTGESLTNQSTATLSNTITNNTTSGQTVIYTVTPTATAGGCIGTPQTVTVTVNPAPIMTSAITATICSGGTVSIPLTSNVASTFTWIATDNINTTGESITSQSTSTLSNTITNNTSVVQTVTYTVTPTSTVGSCAGTPQTVTVTVNPAPTMTSAATATICSGGTVNIPLTSSAASTYTWIATDNTNTVGESLTSQSTSTLSNTITNSSAVAQTVSYTVTPTSLSGSCVGTSQTVVVTVNPTPAMTSAATATICSGGTVSIPLTSNVASSYTWLATDNVNITGESVTSQSTSTLSNTLTNNSTVVQTVTYTVTPASSVGGCIGTPQTVVVTVKPAPIMTSAAVATICSGGTVSIPLTSNIASTYTWIATNNPNTTGESFTSQSTSTLSNTITNNTTSVQTVTYTVTPTSTAGSCLGTPQTVAVTVNPAPTMTSASSSTICSGGTVNIALTSNVTSSYTWIATDNINTTGESTTSQGTSTLNNTITNNSTTVQTITYTVTPTSTLGTCAGVAQTVTVTVNPTPAMTSTASATICSGGTVSIPLTSNIASSYTWQAADNVNTTGESLTSQSTTTLNNTITNNTSTIQIVSYVVTPTSSAGSCVGTPQTVVVMVNPTPAMTSSSAATICSGGTVNIALASNIASTFTWIAADNINTTGESTTSQSTSTLSNTITNNSTTVQTVSYTVTPTSTTGACIGTPQTVVVTVNPAPGMTSASTSTICSGSSVSIPLTSTVSSTYTWIAANNPNTVGESITLQATSTINNTIFNTSTGAQTVVYTVTPTSLIGCAGTVQTVNVTVNAPPNMTSASSITVCSGASVSLSFTSDVASSYSWVATNNPNTTGESITAQSSGTLSDVIINNTASPQTVIYTVTPTSTAGSCIGNTQTISVVVNPLPSVVANTSASTVCAGTSVTLTGSGAYTYVWDNSVTDGVPFIAATTTTYTVIGTNINGCSNSSTVTVTVNSLPGITATSTSTSVCVGTAVTLTGGGAVTYVWSGGVTDGVSFTPTVTTTYTVTGTNSSGCSGTATVTVTVNQLPSVVANASSTSICTGSSVTLTGSGASTYVWNNGVVDGVSFSPTATSAYVVTGTDINGCINTSTVFVNVNPAINTSQTAVLCPGGSIAVGANTYTTTGTYTDLLTAVGGCDSIVVTNVTILTPVTTSQTLTVCAGASVTVGTSTYNTSGTYTNVLTSFRGCDSTVTTHLTVSPAIVGNQTLTICTGASVTVGSSVYTATGVYTDVLTAHSGCDSTVTTHLTVNPTFTSVQNVTVCAGGSVTVGTFIHTVSGTYTDILSTTHGCDSTVTTTLTVRPAISTSQNISVCNGGSITIGSTIHNTSGTYTDILTAANGCDSTVITSLTVLPAIVTNQALAVCSGGSITVGTNTYTTTGIYTDVLTSHMGCDSTVITNFAVHSTLTASQSPTVCYGNTFTINGHTYTTSGTYVDTLFATGGCDSIVTTNLTIRALITSSQTFVICAGQSVIVGTHTHNTTGIYTDTLTSFAGCDSIVTTNLTVNPVITANAGADVTTCIYTSATFNGSGSGGSSPLTYAWTNGINNYTTASITVSDMVSSHYILTVSDSIGCSASDTAALTILSGEDIYGHVTSPAYGDITFGNVYLFRWVPIFRHYDTVAVSGYDASGWYHFTNVDTGKYIVEAFGDFTVYTSPKLMPTYYDTAASAPPAILWDSAFIVHSNYCGSVDTFNIVMKEDNSLTGTGHIHGRVLQGYHYHNFDDPVPGVDIKMGHNPGGGASIFTNTTTSPNTPGPASGGYYDFYNVPDGTYSVYVDIPGLWRDSILTVTINAATGDTAFLQENYYADSTHVYVDSTGIPNTVNNYQVNTGNFAVYPNPFSESATIEYDINSDAEVRLDVYDVVGACVNTLVNTHQQAGKYKYTLNATGKKLAAGVYNVTLNVAGEKRTQRIIVMQ